jgi:CRISPR-associated endonuclease/helicase Cas3
MVMSGLISVSDWIGSNDKFFPWAGDTEYTREYVETSKSKATTALQELGWDLQPTDYSPRTFTQLFPFIEKPNPLQEAVATIAEGFSEPGIAVLEAPMGEGKTEAAMLLADHMFSSQGLRGYYFALPTMTTSTQMFGRIRQFLEGRFPEEPAHLQLMHGHSSLDAEFRLLLDHGRDLFTPIYNGDDKEHSVVASEWFTARKRGLLAPFGVGTVDQILLAALRTPHVFVRLFGLVQKTIIVDEVHAYDTYMTKLLERLLEWLGALSCSVILLSATLPSSRRSTLVQAYARGAGLPIGAMPDDIAYPRVTYFMHDSPKVIHIPSDMNSKEIELRWLDQGQDDQAQLRTLIDKLQFALADGGCAAVICNTVAMSQQVYQGVRALFPGTASDGFPQVELLHGRFLQGDRRRLESHILNRFGKPTLDDHGELSDRHRPDKAILVATQIIEQSLDLDFDIMFTDLAPADFILQRLGRMHRHKRIGSRPQRLSTPQVNIFAPRKTGNVPFFGRGTEAVYDNHVLLRSWIALKDRRSISIPDDIEEIVEYVYADDPLRDLPADLEAHWQQTLRDYQNAVAWEATEASYRWVGSPGTKDQLWHYTDFSSTDDQGQPAGYSPLTRLGLPTVSLLCLYERDGHLHLSPTSDTPLRTDRKPTHREMIEILAQSVSVSVRRIVRNYVPHTLPEPWEEAVLIRDHWLIRLDENGRSLQPIVGNLWVEVDQDIGIRFL